MEVDHSGHVDIFFPAGIDSQRLGMMIAGPRPEAHSYFNASKPLAVLDLASGSNASWNWRSGVCCPSCGTRTQGPPGVGGEGVGKGWG